MTEKELKSFLIEFVQDEMVIAHDEHAPGHFVYKIYAKKDKSRSTSVEVMLREDNYVVVNSPMGQAPQDQETLAKLLEFNLEPVYSKIALHQGDLYEIYLCPLEKLTLLELESALWEVVVLSVYFLERLGK